MRILWVLAVACFISGCGGGGGDSSPPGQVPAPIPSEPPPPPPVQDVSANGNWRASVIEDGIDYTYGIILQDGALLGRITALEDEDIGFLEGSYTVTGTEISGSYRMSTAETGTFSGTVVEGESISLTINSGGETSSLRVNLHPDYNRPSSLSLVQGTWVRVVGGESVSTVTVSADGAFFGQDIFGCVITGAVTIINAAHNLYDLLYSVAACAESNGEYTGYGILSDAPTGGSNNIFVVLTHSRGTNWGLSQYESTGGTPGTTTPVTPEGVAPTDQTAFDALVVGKRLASQDPSYYTDFISVGRFSEVEPTATYTGSYSYAKTGANSGRVVFNYDDGDRCTSIVTFASTTSGTSSYSCNDGEAGTGSWRLIDTPGQSTGGTPGTTTPVTYERLDLIQVSPGRVQFGFASAGRCITLGNTTINGVNYSIVSSKWQTRAGSGSAWSDVADTERTGQLCSLNPSVSGEYRLVAEITVSGTTGNYSSNVMSI